MVTEYEDGVTLMIPTFLLCGRYAEVTREHSFQKPRARCPRVGFTGNIGPSGGALSTYCFIAKSLWRPWGTGSDRAVVAVARIHDVDDPAQVVQRGELNGDLALGLAQLDLDPGLQPVTEALRDVLEARS